jgi:hypothetical protein
VLLLLPVAGFIASRIADRARARHQVQALLGGDVAVQVERFQIDYQQRRVVCSDPVALRYLEDRLRRNDPVRFKSGTNYRLRLWFAGGGAVKAETYWFAGGFAIRTRNRFPAGASEWLCVLLTEPMPPPVKEMIDFLHRPGQEVKGMVLVLEPGGVRREQDRSLVAE